MHALPLPLVMLIVFGSAKLMAELFERLNQPAIVGEILAGVIIGPSVLGWITPNATLGSLADLGVMFLLFGVGMEVKAGELMKVGGTATAPIVLYDNRLFNVARLPVTNVGRSCSHATSEFNVAPGSAVRRNGETAPTTTERARR